MAEEEMIQETLNALTVVALVTGEYTLPYNYKVCLLIFMVGHVIVHLVEGMLSW